MAIEKKWPAVPPCPFTANGNSMGVITVQNAAGFKVKQRAVVQSATQPQRQVQIKRVTKTSIIVGPIPTKVGQSQLTTREDLSLFTVADGAFIFAEEQDKVVLKPEDILQAIYRQEPGTTIGVELADEFGVPYSSSNPLPTNAVISGDITVGTDGFNPTEPDSMLSTGSEDGTKTGIKHAQRVDSELDLRVGISNGPNKASVNADGELSVADADVLAQLEAILAQLESNTSLSIGTEDGTLTGVQRVFVNNLRQQVLASHDRHEDYEYADFGTTKERMTKIDYSSPTFPGILIRRSFTYTQVGCRYRRDSGDWEIVSVP